MQAIDLRAIVIGATAIITTRHARVQLLDCHFCDQIAYTEQVWWCCPCHVCCAILARKSCILQVITPAARLQSKDPETSLGSVDKYLIKHGSRPIILIRQKPPAVAV